MIEDLKDLTLNLIAKYHDFTHQDIPENLKNKMVNNGSKVFKLQADGYNIGNWGHLNTTFVETKGTEIFNLIIFPNDENLPIFASEILIFGEKLYLAVIDVEHTWNDKIKISHLYNQLDTIFQKYNYLPQVKEIPDWAVEYFSDKKIYIRPLSKEFINDIRNAYVDYLEFYILYIINILKNTNLFLKSDKVNDYKTHHALNSPGHNYLSKIFGEEWTTDYLSLFMYKVR